MLVLSPLVLQLIGLGITYTPQLIAAAQAEIRLCNAGAVPTAAERAAIDAALEVAHAALQAAVPA